MSKLIWIFVGWAILAAPARAQGEAAAAVAEAKKIVLIQKTGDLVAISIDRSTQISEFLDQVANTIGKPVLYDPRNNRIAKQQFGAGFRHKVPANKFLDSCRALLGFYELTVIPVGPTGYEIYLVIDSRSTNNLIKNKAQQVEYKDLPGYEDRDGLFISCAVPVHHIENLTTLRTALSSMTSPGGVGRVHEVPGSQTIIITDFAPTVAAMAKLIRQMDVAPVGRERVMEVVELEYAKAKDVADALTSLVMNWAPAAPAQARGRVSYRDPDFQPRIVPYEARNAILIAAKKEDADKLRRMIATLDQPRKEWSATEVAGTRPA